MGDGYSQQNMEINIILKIQFFVTVPQIAIEIK